MSSQEEGAKALAGPDLSKPQGENKFSLLPVCCNFFLFFQKITAYVEYAVPPTKPGVYPGLITRCEC